MDIVKYH